MTERDLTDWEAAGEIGQKVIDMAERVKKLDPVVPGTRAKWGFEMDGTRYEVVVRVAPA